MKSLTITVPVPQITFTSTLLFGIALFIVGAYILWETVIKPTLVRRRVAKHKQVFADNTHTVVCHSPTASNARQIEYCSLGLTGPEVIAHEKGRTETMKASIAEAAVNYESNDQ